MKINIQKLDRVQLAIPIGAEEKGRAFYGGVLGLKEVEKPEELKKNGGLWYQVAGVGLHLGAEEPQPRSKRHLAFKLKNLDEVRAYLQERGAEIEEVSQIAETQRFTCYDCFGNRIEFLERQHL
jgi:catechol 2,3-dioxygenase-like lactoylglutathione lyase family enzyme